MQLIGYLACGITFASFFAASHRRVLLIGATAALFWALHYHLLGERVAAAIAAANGARNTVATWVASRPRRVRIALTLFACAVLVALSLLAWTGPLTLLPTFAACLSTSASFWLIDRAFRRALLVSDGCWLLFGVLAGSIAGMAASAVTLGLNLWTLRRLARQNRATPDATAHS